MDKKPHLIACYSPKGGTGKTTISTQLASSARVLDNKVCFYDLDPQLSATEYFNSVHEKFRPQTILSNFEEAPPKDVDFIFLDCEPSSLRFIPPKDFLIIAPTLASRLDLHAYRHIFELEQQGYNVIRVINQYSMVRIDDSDTLKALNPCCVISQNAAIKAAMNNNKTVWNSNHPNGKRAKFQFSYLIQRIMKGSAETLTNDDITMIGLFGVKTEEEYKELQKNNKKGK